MLYCAVSIRKLNKFLFYTVLSIQQSILTEMCDTHKQLLTQLRTSDETPVVRIKKFIDECSSIIVELDLPTLKLVLQLTSQYAYDFRERRPKLKLADCMMMMLKDKNSITDPILKHYYDAMLLEFLQRSLAVVNAEREHIDDLDSKRRLSIDWFFFSEDHSKKSAKERPTIKNK